jgi:hypothetical protein
VTYFKANNRCSAEPALFSRFYSAFLGSSDLGSSLGSSAFWSAPSSGLGSASNDATTAAAVFFLSVSCVFILDADTPASPYSGAGGRVRLYSETVS